MSPTLTVVMSLKAFKCGGESTHAHTSPMRHWSHTLLYSQAAVSSNTTAQPRYCCFSVSCFVFSVLTNRKLVPAPWCYRTVSLTMVLFTSQRVVQFVYVMSALAWLHRGLVFIYFLKQECHEEPSEQKNVHVWLLPPCKVVIFQRRCWAPGFAWFLCLCFFHWAPGQARLPSFMFYTCGIWTTHRCCSTLSNKSSMWSMLSVQ